MKTLLQEVAKTLNEHGYNFELGEAVWGDIYQDYQTYFLVDEDKYINIEYKEGKGFKVFDAFEFLPQDKKVYDLNVLELINLFI